MPAAISYIGATIAVAEGAPVTTDIAGFTAPGLSYATIGKIASWGEVGDTSNNIAVDLLVGRVEHVNGSIDGGEIAFAFRTDPGDAGQQILFDNSNTNNELSFRITDPDNEIVYFHGKAASVRDMERTSASYKGMNGVVRVNSATIRDRS